jgi:hypothetical protein
MRLAIQSVLTAAFNTHSGKHTFVMLAFFHKQRSMALPVAYAALGAQLAPLSVAAKQFLSQNSQGARCS